jgi:hypothetical protein
MSNESDRRDNEAEENSKDNDILSSFWKLAEGTEVPDLYAIWGGLIAVSSVMGRKCWMDRGVYELYPNLFVLFVSPSGKNRKSTCIGWVDSVLRKLQPKPEILATRITPEAMKMALSGEEGKPKEAHGIILADEFTVFLDRNSWNMGLGNIMCQLYDCKETSHQTMSHGKMELIKPYIVLLGGTTPKTIRDDMPKEFIGSGLASRIICVYVEDQKPGVPFPPTGKGLIRDKIVTELEKISVINGEFVLDAEARSSFVNIYHKWRDDPLYEQIAQMIDGYPSRRCEILLKIAMIICATMTGQRTISKKHIYTAEGMLVKTERFIPSAFQLITGTEVGGVNKEILDQIVRFGMIARPALIREFRHKLNLQEIEDTIKLLINSDEITSVIQGNTMFYRVKPQAEKKGSNY